MKAVQRRVEVVKLGTDVFKALAFGARAVFIGRSIIKGLAYKVSDSVSS